MRKIMVVAVAVVLLVITLGGLTVFADASKANYNFDDGTSGFTPSVANSEMFSIAVGGQGSTPYAYQMFNDTSTEIYSYVLFPAYTDTVYEVTGYVKVISMDASASGASLTVKRSSLTDVITMGSSGFFKNAGDWTKFSVKVYTNQAIWNNCAALKLSLTGKGTVLWDNITVTQTESILTNGSFSGYGSDSTLGGWAATLGANLALDTDTDGTNYLAMVNNTTGIYQIADYLTGDNLYKISLLFKHNGSTGNEAVKPSINIQHTYVSGGSTQYGTNTYCGNWTKYPYSKDWKEYTIYYKLPTVPVGSSSNKIFVYFKGNASYMVYYKDIKMVPVNEGIVFDKDKLTNGTVNISATHIASDWSNPSSAVMLAGLYLNNSEGKKLVRTISLSTGIPSVVETINGGYVSGKIPAILTGEIDVDTDLNGGVYTIEAFLWDDLNLLYPYIQKAVLSE